MAVTPISELREYAEGMEIELPGFVEEKPFIARLRRPSLLLLAQEGTIPNPLLSAASELFRNGKSSEKAGLKDMGELFRVIARAALISPTYEELEEAGLRLTDNQLLYIYSYSQTGVDALRRFREKQTPAPLSGDRQGLQGKAQ